MRSEYRTQRILGPDDKTGRFVGVGTPFIANHPYTDRNYFVFTGWTSYEGAQREVYAAEIHEDFSLTDIRLILPWNEPEGLTRGGHTTSHVAWDERHKCWLVICSEAETSSSRMFAGIYRFNDDFTRCLGLTWLRPPLEATPGPSGHAMPVCDGGAPFLRPIFGPEGTEGCFYYGTHTPGTPEEERRGPTIEKLAIMHTWDYTADTIEIDYNDYVFWGGHPAALQPIQTTAETTVVLVEELWQQNPWSVKPVFLCGLGHYPACSEMFGLQAFGSVIPSFGTGTYHVGHPHATIHPNGQYYNFFHTIFRECTPSFRHEIWCTQIPPSRLDPRSYDSFFTRLMEGPVPEDGYRSKIIPGWFSRELSVLVETGSGGTLTILGGNEFDRVETDVESRQVAGSGEICRFDHVMPYFRIAFRPARPDDRADISLSLRRT